MSDIYEDEREAVCNKILNILNLGSDGTFTLYALDRDIEKQNKILDLKDEIMKYFAYSSISCFKAKFKCRRPYLNIIRSILREQRYTFTSKLFVLKMPNDMYVRTMRYTISRQLYFCPK